MEEAEILREMYMQLHRHLESLQRTFHNLSKEAEKQFSKLFHGF